MLNVIVNTPYEGVKVFYNVEHAPNAGERIYLGFNPAPKISDVVYHYPDCTAKDKPGITEVYLTLE